MERAYQFDDIARKTFYQIPAALFMSPKYRELSAEAKLTYALFLDRLSVSRENGRVDEDGKVYIVFRRDEVTEILNISPRKTTAVFQELVAAELLKEYRVGMGKPNRLYVLPITKTLEEGKR